MPPPPNQDRVGIGSDTHRFDPQRPLILGGLTIPDAPGLAGHSDADALSHAIIDALLGAAALGDIGVHFPPAEPRWKDADSLDMLSQVVDLLSQRGYRIGNVDATIVAEQPVLQPHLAGMRERLASTMDVSIDAVSIKATTAEGLGAIGRGEGLQAQAIARIVGIDD
jgi:2-C-methyl-D-erythritol 2,4-cyclodiphosphate synthase